MTVSTIGNRSSLSMQTLLQMRSQLDQLQQQLGTGIKSTTYAGLGIDRGLSVSLRAQLSATTGYDNTIQQVGIRLDLAQQTLGRIATINSTVKTAAQTSTFKLNAGGQTVEQTTAAYSLDELFSLLNTRAGNRYLFSGKANDTAATAPTDLILNGDATHAGFKQIMAERLQADVGTSGLGRLATTPAGSAVSIGEDVAGSPFGFKIGGLSTTVTGATVTPPAGAPPTESIDFNGSTPTAGQTVTLQLNLPDGTTTSLTLTATNSAGPGPNEFTIGGSASATAANFNTALTSALGTLATTTLTPASAMAAANDFFDVDDTHPPQRVDGPPFDSATGLVDGTSSNTVTWYTGEGGSDPARSTAVARVDPSMTVTYGMRANEEALRNTIKAVAVFTSTSFSTTDPNASEQYEQLKDRVGTTLAGLPGQQQVTDIEAELGGVQATIGAAKDRHAQSTATLSDLLDGIQGVSQEEVGSKILAMQTSLQASLQTTAMMYQTSILNYLGPV
jgi:flagellin-like hook-associated protein FlgL